MYNHDGQQKAILVFLEAVSNIREASMYPDFDGFARLHAHNEPHSQPDAKVYLQRGIAAFQRDDLETAIEYYDRVISFKPEPCPSTVAKAYYNRARAVRSKGDFDRSIEDFDQAIKLKPRYVLAFSNRGRAYSSRARHDGNKDDYSHIPMPSAIIPQR